MPEWVYGVLGLVLLVALIAVSQAAPQFAAGVVVGCVGTSVVMSHRPPGP